MSWYGTYAHTLLVALDEFAAAVFYNRADVTISSLCRAVQLADAGHADWVWRVDNQLKLNYWQKASLRIVGRALNWTFPNHCEVARLSDITRASGTIKLLDDPTLDK